MADYTYEATRISEYRYAGSQVPVALSTHEPAGPHPFKGDCPDHGVHTHLELEEQIEIEREDDTWTLPEKYAVSYCEECLADRRKQAKLLNADSLEDAVADEDPSPRDLVIDIIGLNWRNISTPFEPSDPSNRETIHRDDLRDGESIIKDHA